MSFRQFPLKYRFVQQLADFPDPVSGNITLDSDTIWVIVGAVDIGANKLTGQNISLFGESTTGSSITSSINTGNALFNITGSFVCRNMSIHVSGTGDVFNLNATGFPTATCFLHRVAISQGTRLGTITAYNAFIADTCLFANLIQGITFVNTFQSISFHFCVMQTTTASCTIVTVPASVTITSRIRFIAGSISVGASATGINVSTSATINPDAYVLDLMTFTGAGTLITGVPVNDNKTFFRGNRGVSNTSFNAQYYMNGNATATTNPGIGTYAKIAGTTTAGQFIKFTHTNNRATYTSPVTQTFLVFAVGSLTASSGNEIAIRIAKNGTTLVESQGTVTAQGAAQQVQFSVQTFISLTSTDFVEVFVANISSGGNNVTVRDLNLAINSI